MKIKKLFCLFSIILFFIAIPSNVVHADMGPKPSTTVTIKGIQGNYVAAFAATVAKGPNNFYDSSNLEQDYNPIMEYSDSEGYKWITTYFLCEDEETIGFSYYPPDEFKIIIFKNGYLYKATESMETYAFDSEFTIDFSNDILITTKEYDFNGNFIKILQRLGITLAVEIGLLFAMFIYTKRNLIIALLTNLFTQIGLNIGISYVIYHNGKSIFLLGYLLIFELIILALETLIYLIFMEKKKPWKILLYTVVANGITFALSFILL